MAGHDGKDEEAERARAVGRALKAMRERAGMTQEEAAAEAGLTRTAWQNYENGRPVVLDGELQRRLVKALKGNRLELLAAEDPELISDASPAGVAEETGSFAGPRPPGRAVFPLEEGEVTIMFPSDLTPEGREQLGEYLKIWLKRGS